MANHRNKGQALLEMALTMPILLVLILGAYASIRTSILKSRAESAAFTETLRVGRNHSGIERELSLSILPQEDTVDIRSVKKRNSRFFPVPLPTLAGRTTAAVEVRKRWKEIGAPRWMPTVRIVQQTESNVDCWGKNTSSGERMRRWVRGFVLLGVIR
jgi:hypothetical protein